MYGQVVHPLTCIESQRHLDILLMECEWLACDAAAYSNNLDDVPLATRRIYCSAHLLPYCTKHQVPAQQCELSEMLLADPCQHCQPQLDKLASTTKRRRRRRRRPSTRRPCNV